jgi:hypothetical protein
MENLKFEIMENPKFKNSGKPIMKYRPKYLGQRYPYSITTDIIFIGGFWIVAILWALAGLKWLFKLFF